VTQQPRQTKPSPARPRSAETEWKSVGTWVKIYGWLTVALVLSGSIFLAHAGWLGWGRFTTCQSTGCVRAMHLIEVPLMGYLLFVGYYSAFRATHLTAARYRGLLGFANVVALVFFVFDGVLLVSSFQPGGTHSEKILISIAMGLLLIGASLGGWVRFRVNEYLHPALDPLFEHPRTEGELLQLVKKALAYKVQIRVRGSTHCVREGIYADEGGPHINVQLDRYNQVSFDEKNMRVTVQAGCHLGVDPHNPLSNKKNSLLWQLHKRGWALPDLAGITHQTVSGFFSTGSMGGTLKHNLGGAIVGIRIIDGNGQVHDLAPNPKDPRDEEHNPFYAAGVSMGLLGIVSTLTFQCERRYYIEGTHEISVTQECPARVFEMGKDGLEGFFEKPENEYIRLLWWPQQGVDLVDLWTGKRPDAASRGARWHRTRQAWDRGKMLVTSRRKLRPLVGTPGILQRLLVKPFFTFIAKDDAPPFRLATETLVGNFLCLLLRKKKKTFKDVWYKALPMDDHISDRFVPTEFTELFIDISQTGKLMEVLKKFFCHPESQEGKARGMARAGSYAFEIYPGHQSRFWLSPSHGRHSVRLDIFWFRTDETDDTKRREEFFGQFWKLLQDEGIDFRAHWGKYLPKADSKTGAKYLSEQYDRWNDFMDVRRKWDPEGIFLNTYWKEHLGLGAASQAGQPNAQPELGFESFTMPEATDDPPVRPRARPPVLVWVLKVYFSLKNRERPNRARPMPS
jgi:D-arabinono-1,4-lactone oxidase